MEVAKLTTEDSEQLLRTVEMFEAIAAHQPHDYQSLEILKETYHKLGRKADSLRTSKRLATAYAAVGQISQAALELEGLALEAPDDAEVRTALAELQAKTTPVDPTAAPSTAVEPKTARPTGSVSAGVRPVTVARTRPEDGDLALAHVLITEKVVTPQSVEPALASLRKQRANPTESMLPMSLLTYLADEQMARLEDLLTLLVDKSRLPYLPLSLYDVDRDIGCLLPHDICWQHCIIPFDLLSRSIMIATANPFDQGMRKQVEAMLDYHVFWFVSPPADIGTALRRAYGLDNKKAATLK